MAQVAGSVEAVSTKFGKFGILVDGKWYNTKPEWIDTKPDKGDEVEFDDGGRNYIKKLVIKGGSSSAAPSSSPSRSPSSASRTFPVGALAPERTINRQNALTAAVNYLHTVDDPVPCPDTVIEIARVFEAYTTGDLDKEEAEAALAELTE